LSPEDIVSELGDNFSMGEGHTPRIRNTDTSLLKGRAPFRSHKTPENKAIKSKRSKNDAIAPVGVRIRDAILVFNVPWLEGHLEPDYLYAFLDVP
jgi:hypothetical protein